MEKEYTRTFSIVKLYKLIKGDTARIEVCPFETYNINRSFCMFCDQRDVGSISHFLAWLKQIALRFARQRKGKTHEENAFCVGFKMAVNLIR